MTRAQAEGTSANNSPPDSFTSQPRPPAAPHALHPQRLQWVKKRVFCPFQTKRGLWGLGGLPLCLNTLSLGAHLSHGRPRRERDAPCPTAPTALPPADSKQSTFTLKQPTSHNLICHFLHQKWSSFLWHPDNVNEMENTPSGSYHAEKNQEKDISRGRLSTFLWADETSLIMLDTLCSASPQLTKFWLQSCCLYCHHNTECKNEMKYILTGL